MPGPVRTYRDLLVWQKSMDVAVVVLNLADRMKNARFYALADQLERSAVSIPSNLAEGHGRHSRGDYRRYVAVANGSLRELETQLELLRRFRPRLGVGIEEILRMTDEIGRMIHALYQRLGT